MNVIRLSGATFKISQSHGYGWKKSQSSLRGCRINKRNPREFRSWKIKAFPKDIAALDKRSVLAKVRMKENKFFYKPSW